MNCNGYTYLVELYYIVVSSTFWAMMCTILALNDQKMPKFAKYLAQFLETLDIKMTAEMNTQRNEREPPANNCQTFNFCLF